MHVHAIADNYAASRKLTLLTCREDVAPERVTRWAEVHDRLVALAKQRAVHEREVCRWLLAAERLGVHTRAGYGSLREYAERIVGLRARQTEERLRVGRALADLPALDRALTAGELPFSAVRELTRVATRETERDWLAWASTRRVRDIETAVALHQEGDRPDDPLVPSLQRHRLVFEVRSETVAMLDELMSRVRAELGAQADDDTVLYEIARGALGGPGDEGRAPYQLAVTTCDTCRRTSFDAAGRSHPVDDAVADMVACDVQRLPRAGPHVGVPPNVPVAPPSARARQTIPPATRRAVLRRDHKRCVVPGCTHHRFLDVHHLDPRSEGGGHDPERLAALCGSHHRAVHAGSLCIDGTASGGFVFRHGDGTPYGETPTPAAVDAVRDVLGALEHMGFRPTRARALVDGALRAGAPRDSAALLRAALVAT